MSRNCADLLREKVKTLMELRQMNQLELADKLKKSQSWLSRRLTGAQNFKIRDLDALAAVLGITPPELFFDVYGQWDRRSGTDRRKTERRQRKQTIYDPTLEPSAHVSRIAFQPVKEDDNA